MKLLFQWAKSVKKNIARKNWHIMENNKLKYGDKILYMEGVIVEVHDGCVSVDLKGRLGYLRVPMRMFISDYEIKVGQEVGFNMSFVEQLGDETNDKYISNLMTRNKKIDEMSNK